MRTLLTYHGVQELNQGQLHGWMNEYLPQLVGGKEGLLRGVAPAAHRAHLSLLHLQDRILNKGTVIEKT
jgi:hypothetical protein